MKSYHRGVLWIALLLSSTQPAWAQDAQGIGARTRLAGDRTVAGEPLIFVPRVFNGLAPAQTRLMTSQRDPGGSPSPPQSRPPRLFLLLPREPAVTTQSQPSLFWYLSDSVDRKITHTINVPTSPDPVVELSLNGSEIHGIQRLDLAKLNVTLHPEVSYEWVVTVEVDPGSPSKNIYAKSVIWRVRDPQRVTEKWQGSTRRQRAVAAAEQGIWIDALAWISDLIDQRPNELSLRRDRADLLRYADFQVSIAQRDQATVFAEVVQLMVDR